MQYKICYSTYLFNLHFYPYLSTIILGRNWNTCSYANKSLDQNYCITITLASYVLILVNVIEMLEVKIHNHNQHLSLYKEAVE